MVPVTAADPENMPGSVEKMTAVFADVALVPLVRRLEIWKKIARAKHVQKDPKTENMMINVAETPSGMA